MRLTPFIVAAGCAASWFAAFAAPAEACEFIGVARTGLPRKEAARIVGVVSDYTLSPRGLGVLNGAPALMLKVDEVVSGALGRGDTLVAPLFVGPSCQTAPYPTGELERIYATQAGTSANSSSIVQCSR